MVRIQSSRVVAIGLGKMGAPLAARVASRFPTAVHDRSAETTLRHAEATGTNAAIDVHELKHVTNSARFIVTCLPNTHLTRETVDLLRPSLKPGTIWIDATSGRAEDAAAIAADLRDTSGVHYLDCAVSGGPRGAANGKLAALVGGESATFSEAREVIGTFSDKITHLGPAGSGHLVKAVNNALLAANLLTASEGLAAVARHGVDVSTALQAINGSSGRSWVTMQRYPDNILTGDAYGFGLDMHCKDMDNALRAIHSTHTDGTPVTSPMLELARNLMAVARDEYGDNVDHTETTRLAAQAHRINFEECVTR